MVKKGHLGGYGIGSRPFVCQRVSKLVCKGLVWLYVCVTMIACLDSNSLNSEDGIDVRLSTFDVDNIKKMQNDGHLSQAGQNHIRKILEFHRVANQAKSEEDALRALLDGVQLDVPLELSRQEQELCRLLQVELLVRYVGTAKKMDRPPEEIMTHLQVVLRPGLPLPLDRVSADALIRLGDAAEASGHDGLAMGSYRRAIELMTMMSRKIVDKLEQERSL